MKITEKQLRQIIREERTRALSEAPTGQSKAQGLTEALDHVGAAIAALQRVAEVELESPEGEDPDVRSATLDLMEVQVFLRKIARSAASRG